MKVLVPPPSKSDALRGLLLADALGLPQSAVSIGPRPWPTDIDVLRSGLAAMRTKEHADIDCRDGGAPFRFLLTQACLRFGRSTTLTGTPRLGARPRAPLVQSLRAALGSAGLAIEEGSPWPLRVAASPSAPEALHFAVTGQESSQFASSLLLGLATFVARHHRRGTLRVEGTLASAGYFAMTRLWLERAGFAIAEHGPNLEVTLGQPAKAFEIPADWSAAAFLLPLAWKSGAAVSRLDFGQPHPDARCVHYLEAAGLTVTRTAAATVTGTPVRGLRIDARTCPDAVPVLLAFATVLPAPSVASDTAILRVKESDRLQGVADLILRSGHHAQIQGDTLTVAPGRARDFSYDARDDHRLAMSAAVLAHLHGVKADIHGRDSVGKSFPGFWNELAKLS